MFLIMDTNQNQKKHDWIYLLEDFQVADSMKEACKIIALQKGHKFSSNSFKHLVKIGVVKKINVNHLTISAKCNGYNNENLSE